MNAKTKPQPKPQTKQERKPRRQFPAQEKCRAILAVWSGRRSQGEICRELEINWGVLRHWQEKAMCAILQALEPKEEKKTERPPALDPKLQTLLEKKAGKLASRLEKIQQSRAQPQQ